MVLSALVRPVGVCYPELLELPERPPGARRVLLLGGSVLDPRWGEVEYELRAQLTVGLGLAGQKLVLVNLGRQAHTTLDSLYKYRLLEGEPFDAVVVYHGINDVRANNCPPERFRRDYGHYLWYRVVSGVLPPPERTRDSGRGGWLLLPPALHFGALVALDRLGWLPLQGPGPPRPEWLAHGAELKSVDTVRANLEALCALAAERGEPLLVVGFASLVDDSGGPGHVTPQGLPTELWGRPADVAAGLAAHDAVLREVVAQASAARRAEPGSSGAVRHLDTSAVAALGAVAFRDICHLSDVGAAAFARHLAPGIQDLLSAAPAPAATR